MTMSYSAAIQKCAAVLSLIFLAGIATADELKDRLESLCGGAEPTRTTAAKPAVAVSPAEKDKAQEFPAGVVAEPQKHFPAPVAVTVDLPVLSAYVVRGQVINDEAVVQPALTVTRGNLAMAVWGNMNLTDRVTEDTDEFSEVDLTLSYSRRAGPVNFTGGLVEYLFPNQTAVVTNSVEAGDLGTACRATRELFLTVSAPDWVVVPAMTVYRDIDEVKATYVMVGLSWTYAMGEKVSLTLAGSVGYADADYNASLFGVEKDGWDDGNVSAALSWKALENLTITPSIQFTTLLDGEIKDGSAVIYKDDQSLWGGVKISWLL